MSSFSAATALSDVIVTPLGSNSVTVTDSSVPVSMGNQTSSINSAAQKLLSSSASGSSNITVTATNRNQSNKTTTQLSPNKLAPTARPEPSSNGSYSASHCSSSQKTTIPLVNPIVIHNNNGLGKETQNIPSFVDNSIKAQPIAVLNDNHNKHSLAKQQYINKNPVTTPASNPVLPHVLLSPSSQQSDANINALLAKLDQQIQKSVASIPHRYTAEHSAMFSLNNEIPNSLLNITLSF